MRMKMWNLPSCQLNEMNLMPSSTGQNWWLGKKKKNCQKPIYFPCLYVDLRLTVNEKAYSKWHWKGGKLYSMVCLTFQSFKARFSSDWRRQWHPTPVLLPGKSHGQRSLVGCIYGVAQSRTWLKRLSSSNSSRTSDIGPSSVFYLLNWPSIFLMN